MAEAEADAESEAETQTETETQKERATETETKREGEGARLAREESKSDKTVPFFGPLAGPIRGKILELLWCT